MKVKSDHRSKFSNLNNWKEEAWKNQGFNGIRFCNKFYYKCNMFFAIHGSSNILRKIGCLGMQGWRSEESTRLPPLWPGFDSRTRRHMWVDFVVGSHPCCEGFSPGSPVFLSPQKLTLQIPIRSGNEGHRFVTFAVSLLLNTVDSYYHHHYHYQFNHRYHYYYYHPLY